MKIRKDQPRKRRYYVNVDMFGQFSTREMRKICNTLTAFNVVFTIKWNKPTHCIWLFNETTEIRHIYYMDDSLNTETWKRLLQTI